MSHSIVQPGWLGADYAYSQANPGLIDRLKAANVRFVSRYYKLNSANPQNLTIPEANDLLENGIIIDGNAENDTDDLLLDSGTVLQRAKIYVARAKATGQPPGTPLCFSHDTAPRDSDRPTVMRNLRICFDVSMGEGGFLESTYGGLGLMEWCDDEGLAQALRWQSFAWSTIQRSTPQAALAAAQKAYPDYIIDLASHDERIAIVRHPTAHAFQRYGRVDIDLSVLPDSIDENMAHQAWPGWGSGTNQEVNDMTTFRVPVQGAGALFLGEFDQFDRCHYLTWIDNEDDGNRWGGAPMHAPLAMDQVRNMTVDVCPSGDMQFISSHGRDWDSRPGKDGGDFRRSLNYGVGAGTPGPKGDTGPTGPQGPQGPKGDAGPSPKNASFTY